MDTTEDPHLLAFEAALSCPVLTEAFHMLEVLPAEAWNDRTAWINDKRRMADARIMDIRCEYGEVLVANKQERSTFISRMNQQIVASCIRPLAILLVAEAYVAKHKGMPLRWNLKHHLDALFFPGLMNELLRVAPAGMDAYAAKAVADFPGYGANDWQKLDVFLSLPELLAGWYTSGALKKPDGNRPLTEAEETLIRNLRKQGIDTLAEFLQHESGFRNALLHGGIYAKAPKIDKKVVLSQYWPSSLLLELLKSGVYSREEFLEKNADQPRFRWRGVDARAGDFWGFEYLKPNREDRARYQWFYAEVYIWCEAKGASAWAKNVLKEMMRDGSFDARTVADRLYPAPLKWTVLNQSINSRAVLFVRDLCLADQDLLPRFITAIAACVRNIMLRDEAFAPFVKDKAAHVRNVALEFEAFAPFVKGVSAIIPMAKARLSEAELEDWYLLERIAVSATSVVPEKTLPERIVGITENDNTVIATSGDQVAIDPPVIPVMDAKELAALANEALHEHAELHHLERIVDALMRLYSSQQAAIRKALKPALKTAVRRNKGYDRYERSLPWTVLFASTIILEAAGMEPGGYVDWLEPVEGDLPARNGVEGDRPKQPRGAMGFLQKRLAEARGLWRDGHGLPLLALPTSVKGYLAAPEFIQRLEQYRKAEVPAGDYEMVQVFARLEPSTIPGIHASDDEIQRILAYMRGGKPEGQIWRPHWWICAGRSSRPGQVLKEFKRWDVPVNSPAADAKFGDFVRTFNLPKSYAKSPGQMPDWVSLATYPVTASPIWYWQWPLVSLDSVHEQYNERWLYAAQHVATFYGGKMGTADERARVSMTPHCLGGIAREAIFGIAPMDDFSLTSLSWPVTKEINTFLFHVLDDPRVRLVAPVVLALGFGVGTKDEELRKQVVRGWLRQMDKVTPDIMVTMAKELVNILTWQPWIDDDVEDFAIPPSRVESSLRGIAADSRKAGSFALELLLTAFQQKWNALQTQTGRLVKLATAMATELKSQQPVSTLFPKTRLPDGLAKDVKRLEQTLAKQKA